MVVLQADIDKVRRMTAEPTETIYTDATISGYIVAANDDLNAVAGEIWGEKVASLQATNYDFSADKSTYHLSQTVQTAIDMAKYFNARRKPTTSLWTKDPVEPDYPLEDEDGFYIPDEVL